ncbi:hypothetical protein GCM10020000_42460 [Streptomyces olivoverticillatus]
MLDREAGVAHVAQEAAQIGERGLGASGAAGPKASGFSDRTTPRTRRSSVRAATAFSRMVEKAAASSGGVSWTR